MWDMGKSVYDQGYTTGMTDQAKESIESTGILFKGPMETPKGGGVKSINVTARKTWNTHSNIRKFQTIKGVDTVFSKAGIPHQPHYCTGKCRRHLWRNRTLHD